MRMEYFCFRVKLPLVMVWRSEIQACLTPGVISGPRASSRVKIMISLIAWKFFDVMKPSFKSRSKSWFYTSANVIRFKKSFCSLSSWFDKINIIKVSINLWACLCTHLLICWSKYPQKPLYLFTNHCSLKIWLFLKLNLTFSKT